MKNENSKEVVKVDKAEEKNQKLVIKAKAGNKDAIAGLCDLNYKYIFSVLMSRTKSNKELSEDLTQEVLIKMISNLDKYSNTGFKFRSWLSRIVKSTHVDHLRKEKARIEHYSTSIDFSESGADDEFKTSVLDYNVLSHGSVEQDYIKTEVNERMKEIIISGIESLGNPAQKRAIVLNLFEDLSYNEISEKLDVTLDVTKSLIYRAKQGILKNIVQNNYFMAGEILNQMIVQESVLSGTNNKKIAEIYKMSEGEVEEALAIGLKKVYRFKFFGERKKVVVA